MVQVVRKRKIRTSKSSQHRVLAVKAIGVVTKQTW